MPIDANLIFGLKPPPDPLESFAKFQGVRNLIGQQETQRQTQELGRQKIQEGQMKLEADQRNQRDQELFRQAFVKAGGHPVNTIKLASEAGVGPDVLMAGQKHFAELDEKAAKIGNDKLPADIYKNDRLLTLHEQAFTLASENPAEYVKAWPQFYEQAVQLDPKTADHFSPVQPPTPQQIKTSEAAHMNQGFFLKSEVEKRAATEEARKAALAVPLLTKAQNEAVTTAPNEAGLTAEQQQKADQAAADAAIRGKPVPGRDVPLPAAVAQQKAQIAMAGRPPSEAAQNTLDREAKQFGTSHAKAAEAAATQLEKINEARVMINGPAESQALGIPKVMTALVSGQGSGVRITQAELNAIAKARGIGGDVEGFFNSILGKGKLTAEQKSQLTGLLDDVKTRIEHKRVIANDALDRINSAKNRDEIVAIDKEARGKLGEFEKTAGSESGAGTIRVKRKSDGKTGTIEAKDFDPAKYDKIP